MVDHSWSVIFLTEFKKSQSFEMSSWLDKHHFYVKVPHCDCDGLKHFNDREQ